MTRTPENHFPLPWENDITMANEKIFELYEALKDTNRFIRKGQDILSFYLQPDGDKDEAIDALLRQLDGPEQRVIQKKSFTAFAKAEGKEAKCSG